MGCAALLTCAARADEPFPNGLFPPLPSVSAADMVDAPAADPRPRPAMLVDTGARADDLRASPLLGDRFFLGDVVGRERTKTVYVVPQYHRSPTSPLMFTSIGAAVRDVQSRIEGLVLSLSARHGLACIGTEGDSAESLPRSFELDRLAWQLRDLRVAAKEARVVFPDDAEAQDALATLLVVIENAARDHARILDGVGLAQARLGSTALARFGVEDPGLLARALEIARRQDTLYEERERIAPEQMSTSADAVRDIVRDEFPLYDDSTLAPLAEATATLEARRAALLREGAPELATLITRVLARTTRLADEAIRPDAVRALYAHYTSLDEGTPRTPGPVVRKPDAKTRARLRAIDAQLAALEQEHARITRDDRERHAANKVRAALATHATCALVMGAHHEKGLLRALADGEDPPGVIVVRPFADEDVPE